MLTSRRLAVLVHVFLALLVSLLLTQSAFAQGKPKDPPKGRPGENALPCQVDCPPPPPPPSVNVTPDGGVTGAKPNSTGNTVTFSVDYTGSTRTFTFTCVGKLGPTCTSVSPASASMAGPESFRSVTVTYSVGATVGGTINMTATGGTLTNSGSYTVKPRGVSVTPDGGVAANRITGTGGYSETFTVQNTGQITESYTLSCSGSSNLTCSGTTPATLNLAIGASATATANYSVGAVGSGTLTLTASNTGINDAGTYSVPVIAAGPQPPTVSVSQVNPGPTVERSQCLTIALGPNAASECGDLRIVHPLPATRTVNKWRVPTLLYNSQFAHPFPLIAAIVSLLNGATVPDSVTGRVTIGGVEKAKGVWAGSEWSQARTRRIALGWDGLNEPSGIHTYTLEVRNWYGTASQPAAVATGDIAIVNRNQSPFGTGWWLAGYEQLNPATMVWIGGDGSVRKYLPVVGMTGVWAAPGMDHPDTIKTDPSGNYIRFDKNGVSVSFNPAGQHVYTSSRTGHVTRFYQTAGVLDSIALPSYSAKKYVFGYVSGGLQTVTAPRAALGQPRTVAITTSSGRITSIRDADNTSILFGYLPTALNRIRTRTARAGTITTFDLDAGKRVRQASTNMGPNQPAIVTTLVPLESRGLPVTGSVDTALAYAKLDGPRSIGDTTLFWLNQFGAPKKIVNALGKVTVIEFNDARWPGLATRVQHPGGPTMGATYDARGNVTSVTDSTWVIGAYSTTSYRWDPKWDAITKITMPKGDSVTFGIDPNTGNRLWQQDGRGNTTRVNFTYSGGQVISIAAPGRAVTQINYDNSDNILNVVSQNHFVSEFFSDEAGRDTLINTAITYPPPGGYSLPQTKRILYNLADLDTLTIDAGPGYEADSVLVRKHYNANRQLDTLSRRGWPDSVGTITTKWRYDSAGRQTAEIDPQGNVDSTAYDPAGNVVAVVPRRGAALTVTMQYDELNRLVKRVVPPAAYGSHPSGINGTLLNRPNSYAAYTVAGVTDTFAYDDGNRLVLADNDDARVRRRYYPNGLLWIDSLSIRTVSGSDFTKHTFDQRIFYDLNQRRQWLQLPFQVSPGAASIGYTYDPASGALTRVTDIRSNIYNLAYNNAGELASITWPGQYQRRLGYDLEGRMATDTIDNLGGAVVGRVTLQPVRATTYTYDARGNVLTGKDATAFKDTLTFSYSGLGHLLQATMSQRGRSLSRYASVENFEYDGLGNRTYSTQSTNVNFGGGSSNALFTNQRTTWQDGTGRLLSQASTAGLTSYAYDLAGNEEFMQRPSDPLFSTPGVERLSYYGADGKLRAVDSRSSRGGALSFWFRTFSEYRYDALGRRVWMRANKDCFNDNDLSYSEALDCKMGIVRRTLWDGSQELAEIQMPGNGTTAEIPVNALPDDSPYFENDVADVLLPSIMASGLTADRNPFYGRVAYTHGPGLDQPLAVFRMGYTFALDSAFFAVPTPQAYGLFTINPFWDRQGDAVFGAYSDGKAAECRPVSGHPRQACVHILWPGAWAAYDRQRFAFRASWHGSLLESRRDPTGLQYQRNRFYDPAAGRFTQEDPIGLAGGVNLYGFADGDPVNYGDPFGLAPCLQIGNCLQGDGGVIEAVQHEVAHYKFRTGDRLQSTAFDPTAFIGPAELKMAAAGLAALGTRAGGNRLVGFAAGRWLTHFEKHGAELGYENAVQYLRGANALIRGGKGVERAIRTNGDALFYREATNEFAIVTANGRYLRTYFRPDRGRDYFLQEAGK